VIGSASAEEHLAISSCRTPAERERSEEEVADEYPSNLQDSIVPFVRDRKVRNS
jgi:hypothetical protein